MEFSSQRDVEKKRRNVSYKYREFSHLWNCFLLAVYTSAPQTSEKTSTEECQTSILRLLFGALGFLLQRATKRKLRAGLKQEYMLHILLFLIRKIEC